MALTKEQRRQRIKNRIRKIVSGTGTKPRLAVFRSNKEIYAQVVDDVTGVTISAASSRDKDISSAKGNKIEVATLVGKAVAEKPNALPPLVTLVTLCTPTKRSLRSNPPGFTNSALLYFLNIIS